MEWEYLRSFEAVVRGGQMSHAAKLLGVSQATISRHIARLEEIAKEPLFLREVPLVLTARGEALLEAVKPMVEAAWIAQSALEADKALRGEVTLTTVGELVRWVLADRLPSFFRDYPGLTLRILAGNNVNSLAAGEADVALRWAKPTHGDLFLRKVVTEHFGFFAEKQLRCDPETPWLGLSGSLGQIPEQLHAEKLFSTRPLRLLVEDIESLGKAVSLGLGIAILPKRFAKRLLCLRELAPEELGLTASAQPPSRDLWLVVHASRQRLPKVRAVISWLEQIFAEVER
ncbi:MAG: LysR family transcriptional regulator [Myxococcales bacterium]|nr:LysR family transcriptional regulator [Myxococcales bacterium]